MQLGGDRGCRQKEICISVEDIPVSSPNTTAGEGSGSYEYEYAKVRELEDPEPSNTTIADAETNPAKDNQEKVLENFQETFQDEVIVPADRGCHVAQAFFAKNNLPWVPDCDCQGYYKSVQCVENEAGVQCWCSTPSGSEIHNSRKTLNCTDPQSL